jgi:hypothetical protein
LNLGVLKIAFSDTASGDDFTQEFIRKVQPDTLVMNSQVCPLLGQSHQASTDKSSAYHRDDTTLRIHCELLMLLQTD